MFFNSLLIPITMIGFGRYFMHRAPKKINYWFGYRTTMSMKNDETWIFAHKYFGKIWFFSGIILLFLTIILMLTATDKSTNIVGLIGGIICLIQIVIMCIAIIPTEIALKKYFDEYGFRKI